MQSTTPISFRELGRKCIHIALGVMIVSAVSLTYINAWHLFGVLVFGILLSWLARFYRIPFVSWCLDRFDRPGVEWPGQGAITYLIGALLVLGLFPRDVALAAIMVLAVGDSVSSIVGPFGSIRTKLSETKLFEGTFFGGLFGGCAALVFVSPFEAFLASFTAMVFEAMEIRFNQRIMNDNIIVPLVAGAIIIIIRKIGLV